MTKTLTDDAHVALLDCGYLKGLEYYDLKKNWRKVRRHIDDPAVQAVLVSDMNKFTFGRWGGLTMAGKARPISECATFERVNEILRYDPIWGKFFWRISTSNKNQSR